jgi:hypothetical protein
LDKTADYFSRVSYGKIRIIGEVKGWYRLPHPLSYYNLSPYLFAAGNRRQVWRLVGDSVNAAEGQLNYKEYDQIILVLGVDTELRRGQGIKGYRWKYQCANPGILSGVRYGKARMEKIATQGGQHFNGGIVVVAQNAHQGHIVHDFAHALGGVMDGKRTIPDLYSYDLLDKAQSEVFQGKAPFPSINTIDEFFAKWQVYMGPWDVMSRHVIDHRHSAGGMSSFTLMRMGWIDREQMAIMSPGERGVITLSPLANGKGLLALKIPTGKETYYLLENRQKLGIDRLIPSTGLLILEVDESRQDGGGIVRLVDANPKVSDFGAATFGVGSHQNNSVDLQTGEIVEILWQEDRDLTILVSTIPDDSDIKKKVKLIRETYSKSGLRKAKELITKIGLSD